ncbi:MAG: YfhO family protein [Chloroflexota bacterium]|nr:YfhO family protein [Chloroflexota bacterium]
MRCRDLFLDMAGLALLALVVLAFFWPLLLADQWIPRGGGDLVSFLWPTYRFAARSLRAGLVPLWNPHLYSGAPFVADNQSGVFYPINLLTFALFGEPSYGVIEALVVFHIWLAGAGLFGLARGLGLCRPAALVGGVAFALCDLFVTHAGNLNLNATAAWLPLLLLLTHRALIRKSAIWAAGAGVVLAVAALAGHAQMLLFLALTLVLYFVYRLAADWRQGSREGRPYWRCGLRTLALATIIVVVGVGGAALTLLPAHEMAAHTGRGHLPYDEATRYSLPPRALIGLLAPGFYGRGPAGFWGPWERVEVGYAGVATLVLAALAIGTNIEYRIMSLKPHVLRFTFHVSRLEDFPITFFTLLVVLGLLLALGRYAPFYGLLYRYAPTFDQVRVPARLILLADLGLAGLAAYGLDRLSRGGVGRCAETRFSGKNLVSVPVWIGLGALIAGGLLLVIGLPQARTVVPLDRVPQAMTSIIIAAVLLGLSGLLVWLVRRHRWAAWLFPLLLAADLVWLGSTLEAEPNDPTLGFRHEDVVTFLRQDPGLFRIEGATGAWQPDAALVHGLYDVGGVYNPLGLAPYQAYRWAVGERGGPLYNLLGVKYVLAGKGKPPGDERLVPVYTANPEIDVYLNTAALPRALLVYHSQVVPDHAAAWEAIHAPGFDPTQTVVLEREQVGDWGLEIRDWRLEIGDNALRIAEGGHISFVRYGVNEVELAVRTPVSGYLVLSDVYYPGWRATVDGVRVGVLRADYVFRAVLLPPGEHTVRMEFEPWTWRVGLAVSIVTWVGLGVWAGVVFRRRVRRVRS